MESIDLLQNDVRILGANGSKNMQAGTSCLQLNDETLIDAGNIIQALGEKAAKIDHIFLTHSHLDHIVDLAFLIERYFTERSEPLKIYGLKETLDALRKHYFNDTIWPDFTKIRLEKSDRFAVELITIDYGEVCSFENFTIKALPVEHTVATCAYVVEKRFFALIYAPDTHISPAISAEIEANSKIDSLLIDLSFPSSKTELAKQSGHLTPLLLEEMARSLSRTVNLYAIHLKEPYRETIIDEVTRNPWLKERVTFLQNGAYLKKGLLQKPRQHRELKMLTALAKEKDLDKILEMILMQVMELTHAEGGTVYLKNENALHFKAVINKKLAIHNTNTQNWPPVPLYTPQGSNLSNVSALCALKNEIINIPDVYEAEGFNFEGMKKFDTANHYRSRSMLVIPMVDHEEELIGVLQLINKEGTDKIPVPFDEEDIQTALAYSAYCAIAITKNRLIDDLEKLLLSFLESIAVAMDAKSPVGYGHITRVGKMMELVSQGINEDRTKYRDLRFSRDELMQLKLAAWMHDIGKIATPESILNKATKLETTYNRIEEIKIRFQSVILSLKLAFSEKRVAALSGAKIDIDRERKRLEQEIETLHDDLEFLKQKNLPSGLMSEADLERLDRIAAKRYLVDGREIALLKEDEVKNLAIRYGTLNDEERAKINEHAEVSNRMLDMLVFPKKFRDVPRIAGMHHEKLNGKGYPNKVPGKDIPFEARLLAIIDIFEALTAHDRPYKRPKTLKESYEILDNMVREGEIDGEIVDFLKSSGLFEKYAREYLLEEQLVV